MPGTVLPLYRFREMRAEDVLTRSHLSDSLISDQEKKLLFANIVAESWWMMKLLRKVIYRLSYLYLQKADSLRISFFVFVNFAAKQS
jgi:hypothetical protein